MFSRITQLFFLFMTANLFAQTPGLIYKPSTTEFGKSILDPNGDGFTSLSSAGFSGTDYAASSELRMIPLPVIQGEPHSDLSTGAAGGHTDIVSFPVSGQASRESSYILYKTVSGVPYVIIRMRIGKASTSPKGYSFLLNTDGSFNTGSSGNNPGYDKEIVMQTGNPAIIAIYSHTNTSTTQIASYPAEEYSQYSVALSTNNTTPDYFYDFFIPFSALGITNNPVGITAVTVTSAGSGITGTISDFNGVDDRLYGGNTTAIMTALISSFPAIPLTQLTEDFDYNTAWQAVSLTPVVNSGILTSASSISGSSSESNGTVITVYKNGVQIGSTVTVNNNFWTLTGISGLAAGDLITSKALATGKSLSALSNSVQVTAGQPCTLNAPVITARSNGSRSLTGTAPANSIVTIFKINADGSFTQATSDLTSGTNPSTASATGAWGPISKFGTNQSDFTATSYVAKATLNGCTSDYSLINAGGSSIATSSPQVITTPILESAGSTSVVIRNLHASNANLFFYVNGQQFGVSNNISSQADVTFSYSGFVSGDVVYARSIGIVLNSTLSGISNQVTVTGSALQSISPKITGTYLAGSGRTISGTSIEAAGTSITVYKGATLLGTVSVSSFGSWQLTNQTLAASDVLTAYAKAASKSLSTVSNSVTVVASAPTAPALAGTYVAGNTTISGSSGNTLVRVYVDGSLIGTAVPTTGNWSLSGFSSKELYRGAVIHATNVVSGIESAISNTQTVTGVASFDITRQDGTALGTITSGDTIKIRVRAKDASNGAGNVFTDFTNVVTLSSELNVLEGEGQTQNFSLGQLGAGTDKNLTLGGVGANKKVFVVNPNDPTAFGEATVTVTEALWRGRTSGDATLIKAHNESANWTHSRVPAKGATVKFAADVQQDMVISAEYEWESLDFNNAGNTHSFHVVLNNSDLKVQSVANRGNSVVKTLGSGKLMTILVPNQTFEFPIANSSNNFLSVRNNAAQSEVYAARVIDEVYVNGYSGNTMTGTRVMRTWDISKNSNNTATNVNLTFSWSQNQEADYNVTNNYSLYHWTAANAWAIEMSNPNAISNRTASYNNYTGTFSPFAIADGMATALPIDLLSINTECLSGAGVEINWQTASEINTSHFEIYSSNDAMDWYQIGSVNASGNSSEISNYNFNDVEVSNTVRYYQIKAVDLDGSFKMLPIISRQCSAPLTAMLYPNPARNSASLKIEIEVDMDVLVEIVDVNGKAVLLRTQNLQSGSNLVYFDIANLETGLYIVRMLNNSSYNGINFAPVKLMKVN